MFDELCAFLSYRLRKYIQTMSAKGLGTFPVICAIDEVQNPLPLKTLLFERHMTSIIGIRDTFPNSYGPWLLIKHCIMGERVYILVNASETGRG